MKFFMLLLCLFLIACETTRPLASGENIWVARGSSANDYIYYCESKKEINSGVPKPICYEAGIINHSGKIGILK